MEIYRQHGMSEAIYEQASPQKNICQMLWQSSLGGDGPFDRKLIARLPSFGGYEGTEMHAKYRCAFIDVRDHDVPGLTYSLGTSRLPCHVTCP